MNFDAKFEQSDMTFEPTFDIIIPLKGDPGASAYEIAVDHGFIGTAEDWLASLHADGVLRRSIGTDSIIHYNNAFGPSHDAQPIASGQSAVALGRYTKASGDSSIAVNYQNTVEGSYSFAANKGNKVSGNNSFAAGGLNQTNEAYTFVAGYYNIVNPRFATVFGKWNDPNSKAIFAVGNGKSDATRSNAFEVFDDGTIAISGVKFTAKELRDAIDKIKNL